MYMNLINFWVDKPKTQIHLMADTFKYFVGPYKKAYQNIDWKLRRASIQLLKT